MRSRGADCDPGSIDMSSLAHLELPPADTKRWSAGRKAAVVVALRAGVISRAEAFDRYLLSEEELAAWEMAFDKWGIPGLRSGIRYSDQSAGIRGGDLIVDPLRRDLQLNVNDLRREPRQIRDP
jgi:hypothetical protein